MLTAATEGDLVDRGKDLESLFVEHVILAAIVPGTTIRRDVG